MGKRIFKLFKTNKGELTPEELRNCSKLWKIIAIIYALSTTILCIGFITTLKGINIPYIGIISGVIWIISFFALLALEVPYKYKQK